MDTKTADLVSLRYRTALYLDTANINIFLKSCKNPANIFHSLNKKANFANKT